MNISYTKTMVIGALLLCMGVTAAAQSAPSDDIKYRDDKTTVKLYKKVEKSTSNPDQYLITLESFVTGSKETHITEVHKPSDFVVLMDLSGSMAGSVGGDSYYPVSTTMQLGYNVTKYSGHSESASFNKYFALNNTGVNTPLYYKHSDGNYYPISRGYWTYSNHKEQIADEEGNILKGRIYYIFFTDGTSRYYLGYNQLNSRYEPLPAPSKQNGPFALKQGAPEGSSDLSDYYAVSGYYVCTGVEEGTTNPSSDQISTAEKTILFSSNQLYSKSRMGALREAVNSFIDIVAQDDKENLTSETGHHRLALVKFSSSTTSDIVGNTFSSGGANITQSLTDFGYISNVADIAKLRMDQLIPSGTTYINKGMQMTKQVYRNPVDTDDKERNKVLIVFTDGEPQDYTTVAEQAIDEVKLIKEEGVTVYVVGLIDNPNDQNIRFMEYLSSDYPDATGMDTGGNMAADKYFKLVSTGEQLKDIFTTIASNESQIEVGYDLSESSQVVLDALTNHFMLPENATAYNIGLYTRDYLGIVNGVYSFNSRLDPIENMQVSIDGREIVVTGFNFAANWCGIDMTYNADGTISSSAHGKELVITIPIVVDPSNPGGATNPTNDAKSGIYLDDGTGKPDMNNPVNKFPVPSLSMPNIIIYKEGLKGNDCAIFKIIKLDDEDKPEEGTLPFTVILTPSGQGKVTVKLVAEGRYKVVEDSWSWSYDITPGGSYTKDDGKTVAKDNYVIRTVGEATADKTENGTIFNFSNSKKTDPAKVPSHGEDAVNNVFFTPKTTTH